MPVEFLINYCDVVAAFKGFECDISLFPNVINNCVCMVIGKRKDGVCECGGLYKFVNLVIKGDRNNAFDHINESILRGVW